MPKRPDSRSDRPRAARDVPGAKNPYIRTRSPNKPKLEPHLTTLWSYPSQHYGNREQGAQQYRGATPSWVIWEVIQRFSKEGDLVVDPFCGSGTTLDVCKDTGRTGRGFDVAPFRDDIEEGDARALPLGEKSVDVVFMDPPYADNLAYSDAPNCIGKTRADDGTYAEAMAAVLDEANRVLRRGGALAIYVQDIWHEKQKQFYPLGLMLAQLGMERFVLVDHVCVVRNNEKLSRGNHRAAAIERGFMLRGFNHLLLFKKDDRAVRRPERPSPSGKPAGAKRSEARSRDDWKTTSRRNEGRRTTKRGPEPRPDRDADAPVSSRSRGGNETNAEPKKRKGLPAAFKDPQKKRTPPGARAPKGGGPKGPRKPPKKR